MGKGPKLGIQTYGTDFGSMKGTRMRGWWMMALWFQRATEDRNVWWHWSQCEEALRVHWKVLN